MIPVLVATLLIVNVVVLTAHASTKTALRTHEKSLSETRNALESRSKALQELSQQKTTIDASLREERLKAQNLQTENESLKVELQAKLDRKAKEAQAAEQAKVAAAQKPVVVAPVAQKPAPTVSVSGSKADWLAASGISQNDWGYVDSIVTRESGWNPNAVNPSSGACGLGQQLPCGKWAGAWNDPVAALRAQHQYVKDRYGSYAGAVAFWNANHWY